MSRSEGNRKLPLFPVAPTVLQRYCNGIATVPLRYHSHVDPVPHGSDTVALPLHHAHHMGALPLHYRCTTVGTPSYYRQMRCEAEIGGRHREQQPRRGGPTFRRGADVAAWGKSARSGMGASEVWGKSRKLKLSGRRIRSPMTSPQWRRNCPVPRNEMAQERPLAQGSCHGRSSAGDVSLRNYEIRHGESGQGNRPKDQEIFHGQRVAHDQFERGEIPEWR